MLEKSSGLNSCSEAARVLLADPHYNSLLEKYHLHSCFNHGKYRVIRIMRIQATHLAAWTTFFVRNLHFVACVRQLHPQDKGCWGRGRCGRSRAKGCSERRLFVWPVYRLLGFNTKPVFSQVSRELLARGHTNRPGISQELARQLPPEPELGKVARGDKHHVETRTLQTTT